MNDPGFAEVTEQEWQAAAERALKGEPLSSLRTELLGGLATEPLYGPLRHSTSADPAGLPGEFPFTRGASAAGGAQGWEVRQTHDVTRPTTPDAIAVDTTSGVDAITVARGWGAASNGSEKLAGAIGDAAAAGVRVHLQSGTSPGQVAVFTEVLAEHGVDVASLDSWLGLDPIAEWSKQDEGILNTQMIGAAVCAAQARAASPTVVPLEADGSIFAEAGASDVTELACVLANAVAQLRALCDDPEGPGLALAEAVDLLAFTLAAGPDPFLVTAKCRALRACWAQVLRECGLDQAAGEGLPMRLHVVTSGAMMSVLDPWMNMLRVTTACFGAANGGADAITVAPHDSAIGDTTPSESGWRVAANTQLILRHESRIGSVVDPAGGSWYIEELTGSLAEAAWQRFTEIEAQGGICAAVAGPMLGELIESERNERCGLVDKGEQVLVGVSRFVDSDELEAFKMLMASSESGLGRHRWAARAEAELT